MLVDGYVGRWVDGWYRRRKKKQKSRDGDLNSRLWRPVTLSRRGKRPTVGVYTCVAAAA